MSSEPSVDLPSEGLVEGWADAVLASCDDVIIGLSLDGRVISWNAAAQGLYGFTHAEIVGRHLSVLVGDGDGAGVVAALHRMGASGQVVRYVARRRLRGGRVLDLSVSLSPVVELGRVVGAAAVVRDVTDVVTERERLAGESAARYRSLFTDNSAVMLLVDPSDGAIVDANPAAAAFYGWSRDDLRASKIADLNTLSTSEVHDEMRAARDRGQTFFEFRHRLADGTVRDVEVFSGPVTFDGRTLLYSTVHDVTSRRRSEEGRRAAERLVEGLVGQGIVGVAVESLDGRLSFANHRLCQLLGRSEEEIREIGLTGLTYPDDRPGARRGLAEIAAGDRTSYESVTRFVRSDGEQVHTHVVVTAQNDADNRPVATLSIFLDISDRHLAERQLHHEATHDALTGLTNRRHLMDLIETSLHEAQPFSLLFCDLDGFKAINDGLGHGLGDQLLVLVSQRLSSSVRTHDLVARIGGDEFAVLCPGANEVAAQHVAGRLLSALDSPLPTERGDIKVSASIGIAVSEASAASDAPALLRNADLAMYDAKQAGRGSVAVFHRDMEQAAVGRVRLERALREAIEQDQLVAYYQPVLRLSDLRTMGFEALVRWQHPRLGLVPPDDFIPAAEQTGLIRGIDQRVLAQACDDLGRWRRAGHDLRMAVNLSARQFTDPGLVPLVTAALDRAQLEPSSLRLEMTETVLMDDAPTTLRILRRLASLGVALDIDDFGTGYSSLSYLKRFPVTALKLDRRFVAGLPDDREDLEIVTAVIRLAHALDLPVVGEGVETSAQVATLTELGCDFAQGYYFCRPMSATHTDRWLNAGGFVPPAGA
jgi:diguanylate cyclase (GGDEF)-like protein/PAS domain S-box-containing protein